VSRSALTGYLRFGYVGGESSIFEGIAKVGPGQLVRVTPDDGRCVTHEWWSASAVVTRGVQQAFQGSPTEAIDELDRVLREAVRGQMVADVAVGAFLSGGIDSSLVVALMQQESATPVRTYSIGFHEKAYNEARHAKAVAAHLGTQHTELYVSPQDAMAVIPRLPELYSEPFADSSQIPTYLVSRLARGSVTVALSGDAGDELFAGYNRYRAAAQLWGRVSGLPEGIKRAIAGVLRAIPPSAFGALDRLLPFVQLADKAPKAAAMLESATLDDMYRTVTSQWFDPKSVVVGGTEPPEPDVGEFVGDGVSGVERMMLRDLVSYLPGDILAKVDRAAMGVSLETRVPFLDHRVVEFAWSLPLEYKLRGGTTKWPLRSLLDRYVPRALVDRPKMGFAVPVDRWLRGPLRQWADGLLDESRIRSEGFFEPLAIQRAWQEHLSGARNRQAQLWGVLMFQAWKERYGV
jgi:asparagine synthase (glutamine-hydrolysing)